MNNTGHLLYWCKIFTTSRRCCTQCQPWNPAKKFPSSLTYCQKTNLRPWSSFPFMLPWRSVLINNLKKISPSKCRCLTFLMKFSSAKLCWFLVWAPLLLPLWSRPFLLWYQMDFYLYRLRSKYTFKSSAHKTCCVVFEILPNIHSFVKTWLCFLCHPTSRFVPNTWKRF